jgi:hypothetical protein
MRRSIDRKLTVRKQTLRTLAGAELRRVVGGAVVGDVDGGSGGDEQALAFPICTNTQIGMDRWSCTDGGMIGVVIV